MSDTRVVTCGPRALSVEAPAEALGMRNRSEKKMAKYEIREEMGSAKVIEAASMDEACEEAREWAQDGSYDAPGNVKVYVTELTGAAYQPQEIITVCVGAAKRPGREPLPFASGATSEENSTLRANSLRTADTRIIPVKRANKAKTVHKLENGDLRVTLNSGHTFDISKDDALFQEFLVWTMLDSECTE